MAFTCVRRCKCRPRACFQGLNKASSKRTGSQRPLLSDNSLLLASFTVLLELFFMKKHRLFLLNSAFLILSVVVSLLLAEGILRLKNASIINYDIEMWQYARKLKKPVENPRIGHDHIANAKATLQSVELRTNSWGLRGGPVTEKPEAGKRRILVLGDSFVLGWGVEENQTLSRRLQSLFEKRGDNVEVLNGGIGNYNTQRTVEHFLAGLAELEPTDIIYLASSASAEMLHDTPGNFFMRNSQLAVTCWLAYKNFAAHNEGGKQGLIQHYQELYQANSPGVAIIREELQKLADYGRSHNTRIMVAFMPDIRFLTEAATTQMSDRIVEIGRSTGMPAMSLLPQFQNDKYEDLRIIAGDFHFNAATHDRIANVLFAALSDGGIDISKTQ
ncbi:hypothetical protein C0081_13970 [Cohaesibacter celericrescens]|uniref:SGNH hydrolase-type esterase domain-containing protein n=2 Tax=Cohaesibacter celericrescens TaxID=2067669 RepID=A0A2N5XPY2_9HYPH|nr:hypothetical protein C0081_13970 [Cohaesibacter celericrescens]